MEQNEKKEYKFSDYIYVLYKWKKFLIINLFVVVALASLYAFTLPLEYRATATVMIPPENEGFGGLTSLLGGKSSIASLGSKLFGVSNTSEDVLLGILNSRSALVNVINKFNLMEYYEIDDNNWDKVLKAFRRDISTDPNEYGMIEVSVINKDPQLSADIANYMVNLVDSLNIEFNIQRAKNNRMFIEKRYLQNVRDLKNAEDSLYKFQRKYGIVAVPEQLEVTVKAAAEIEAELFKKEIEAHFVEQVYGKNSIQYSGLQAEINLLKNKVQELKNSASLGASSNILYPFSQMPEISVEYLRAFREVEIQQSILEYVMPMYEQAKVEEQNSIPTVILVDEAVPPELKYSPKRLPIILGIFFLFLFLFIPVIFLGEKIIVKEKFQNPLQQKAAKFFTRVLKIYRIKI